MKRRKKNPRKISLSYSLVTALTGWAVLFALLIGIAVQDKLTVSGMGYLQTALLWFVCFSLLGMGGLFHGVSRMVSLRVEKGSTKNARKVVAAALTASVLTGVILTVILYFAAPFLAEKLCGVELAVPALQCFSAAILPLCLMMVLMGGLDGLGFSATAMVPGLTGCVTFLAAAILCSSRLRAYGDNVGALLQNEEFGPAYAAFGCAAGFVCASWTGLLASVLGWIYKKRAIHLMAADETDAVKTERHMLMGVISARITVMLTLWIPVLCLVIQNILFQKKAAAGSDITAWGNYAGITGSILVVPFCLSLGFAVRQLPALRLCFERRNLKKSRARLLVTMRSMAVLTFPCAFFTAVLAEPMIGMVYGQAQHETVTLLRVGSFTLIFWGLAAALGSVLWSMKREKMVPLGLLIAGILMLVFESILFSVTKLGINAVMWADLIWSAALFLFYFVAVVRLERIRINWIRVFLPPVIGSVIASLVCFFLNYFLSKALPDAVTCLVSLLIGAVLYFIAETTLHGINPKILQEFPGGEKIYAVAHLLRLM